MKAITLMQPWASLVALRAKRYETRSWKTNYRGPLAIHSSLNFSKAGRDLCRLEPFASALIGNEVLPLGCVVAICDLAAVYPTSQEADSLFAVGHDWPESERPFGDFSPGRYAWLLTNVRALENPIPVRGARSLWDWDETALGLTDDQNNIMKSKKITQFRQGDVLIEQVDSLPAKGKKRPPENGRIILAHGEVTGHAHEIADPQLASLSEIETALRLLGDLEGAEKMTQAGLVIRGDSSVVHQEHATIPLARGKYVVRRQREYSPEAIRNVAD